MKVGKLIYTACSWLLGMLLLFSCKEDEGGVPEVRFPEMQSLLLDPGAQQTLQFEVSGGYWELYSDQPVWCRLSYDNQADRASVIGAEGSVTVTVLATDDLASFEAESTCHLILHVAGQEQPIATVVRRPYSLNFELRFEEQILAAGSLLCLDNNGEATIQVADNFGTPEVRCSDWLEVSADGEGSYTLALAEDYSLKYPVTDGYIAFSAPGIAGAEYRYPVFFPGMDPEKVRITGYRYQPQGQNEVYTIPAFGWEVSADGRQMSYVRPNGDVVVVEDTLTVTADALNDQIVFARLLDNRFVALTGDEFFHVAQQESRIAITVDPLPSGERKRSATLYAFATQHWNRIADNIVEEEESYTSHALFSFLQQEEAVGFEIEYYHWTDYEIYQLGVEQGTTEEIRSQIRTYVPAVSDKNIFSTYTAEVPANSYTGNKALTVGILYEGDEWSNATGDQPNFALLDLTTGADLCNSEGFVLDAGLSQGGRWQLDLGFPGSTTHPLLLVIYDPNDRTQVLKVLVINL